MRSEENQFQFYCLEKSKTRSVFCVLKGISVVKPTTQEIMKIQKKMLNSQVDAADESRKTEKNPKEIDQFDPIAIKFKNKGRRSSWAFSKIERDRRRGNQFNEIVETETIDTINEKIGKNKRNSFWDLFIPDNLKSR